MEHVRDLEPVLGRQLIDPLQHLGQAGAGDHAILDVVGGCDPAHRGERGLARLPDQFALGLAAGDADLGRALALDQGDRLLEARVAFVGGAVELDHQRRARVEPVPDAGRRLGGLDRQPVHHLDRARDDPRRHDRADRLAGLRGVVEERDQRPYRLGTRHDPYGDPGGNAERPLGPHERTEQVVARRVAVELHHAAVREHDLEPDDVVGREPVLEAVSAARVLGDVPANRTNDLARRIGGIEMGWRDRMRDREVRHPRLHHDAPVVQVDRDDPPQSRQHDQHAVGDRQRPAGKARPGAPGHPGHTRLEASGDDVADLFGFRREHHGERLLAIVGKRV